MKKALKIAGIVLFAALAALSEYLIVTSMLGTSGRGSPPAEECIIIADG